MTRVLLNEQTPAELRGAARLMGGDRVKQPWGRTMLGQMIATGLASAGLAVLFLAWARRYRGRRLLLAAVGWVTFVVGLAAAFEAMPAGPGLFLLGCIAGSVIQLSTAAPSRAEDPSHAGRSLT